MTIAADRRGDPADPSALFMHGWCTYTLDARGLVLVDIVPTMEKEGTDRIGAFMTANMASGFDGRWFWHWDPAFIRGSFGDLPSEVRDTALLMDCARSIQVPLASFSDVAEAAHMVAGDRNDAFTAEVAGFLDGLD